jgi:hypothetical protein
MLIHILKILIAAISTSFFFAFLNLGISHYSGIEEILKSYISFILYLTVIFFILGLVMYKVIDFISERNRINPYFIGLPLYTLIALLFPFFTFAEINLENIIGLGLLPVLTFFHILILINKITQNLPNKV